MSNTLKIWNKIKEREFDLPLQAELFQLIEKNMGRITFVRDHIGLRDVLFMAEESTTRYYQSSLFAALDVEFSRQASIPENDRAFQEAIIDDPEDVVDSIQQFFEHTDRILYVGIGFIETTNPKLRSQKTPYQMPDGSEREISMLDKMILEGLHTGKYRSPQEAMKELREFPEWYVGTSIMPEEANQVTPTEERIERKKAFIAQEAQLNGLIDEALDKTDKDAFDLYTNMLKNLRENAN